MSDMEFFADLHPLPTMDDGSLMADPFKMEPPSPVTVSGGGMSAEPSMNTTSSTSPQQAATGRAAGPDSSNSGSSSSSSSPGQGQMPSLPRDRTFSTNTQNLGAPSRLYQHRRSISLPDYLRPDGSLDLSTIERYALTCVMYFFF